MSTVTVAVRPAKRRTSALLPSFSRDSIPWFLLGALCALSLVTALTQAHRYGVTVDEPLQQQYGQAILAWYRSLGKNTSFLTAFPHEFFLPEHGGIFDGAVAALQSLFHTTDPWLVRHIVTGLAGWLGIVAIALCGYELGGGWVAFAAALGLWLYPRYSGAMFNNPKDIPAAVSLTFALWALLRLVKRWRRPASLWAASALLGCCMGIATAVRVTAITVFPVLAALLVGWWIINGRSVWREQVVGTAVARQAGVAGTIAVTWLLTTMALWPFVFLNPLANLVESVQVMSHYPWDGLVLFNGVEYRAPQLPTTYIPTWLVIGSPPMLLFLSLAGLVIAGVEVTRTRRINPAVGTVALAFGVPLAELLLVHPVLYDSLRQFLYIIPPLVLLAAYGLVRAVVLLAGQQRAGLRWMAVALLAVTVGAYALVIADMVALSPYEYVYFSPLVGGLQGASGTFETDYYGSCGSAAVTWLSQNYRQYTRASSPTIGSSPLLWTTLTPFFPASFRPGPISPDFYIAFTREHSDLSYPTYRVIHVVAAEGVPLCVVKMNPALAGPATPGNPRSVTVQLNGHLCYDGDAATTL